jgi:phage baseplate assembly protein V
MNDKIQRLIDRLSFAIGRGRVTQVDDSGPIQSNQIDLGPVGPDGSRGVRNNSFMANLFGFTSSPPLGTDCILVFPGGRRSNGVVIGHNHQASRLRNLGPGDTAMYDVRGAYLWLTATGAVLDAAGLAVTVRNAKSVIVTTTGAATLNCNTAAVNAEGGVTVTTPQMTVTSSDG